MCEQGRAGLEVAPIKVLKSAFGSHAASEIQNEAGRWRIRWPLFRARDARLTHDDYLPKASSDCVTADFIPEAAETRLMRAMFTCMINWNVCELKPEGWVTRECQHASPTQH